MTEPRERLAAVDVGSNSVRLLVADGDPSAGLTVIDEVKSQPRLGRGLAATGRLDEGAVERALEALARMRAVCDRRGVNRIAAVATAAVREAANGAAFVQRVRDDLGLPLRVIDPATEAALSFRSVAHHFDLSDGRAVVADIGGGSLELIGAVAGLVETTISLPLGAVRLTETHLSDGRDPLRGLRKLRRAIRRTLREALPRDEWGRARIFGSGGTFTTLARVALARRGDVIPDSVHGVVVGTAEVEQLIEWLATRSGEARRGVPGLNPERADIILAGLAVVAELLDRLDARSLTVSAFGLREGLLLKMAGTPVERRRDPMRLVRELAERCQTDRRHVEQVRYLSLLLFDQLAPTLGAEPGERELLEAAALLHDVGHLVSYRRHHRHSFQLIMHAERLALAPRERLIVALVSRYHRRGGPAKRHPDFARLEPADRAVVRRLSGILRVADGLDRGHLAVVHTVTTELTDDRLVITVVPRLAESDLALECWGATRKADVLEKVLRRTVEIRSAVGEAGAAAGSRAAE